MSRKTGKIGAAVEKHRGKRLILLWISVIIWAGAAWTAFTIPGDKLPKTPALWDSVLGNGAHFAIFFILAGLFYNAFTQTRKDAAFRSAFLLVFIGTAAYGVVVEIYQGFVPGRYPSIKDGIMNAVGALNFLALAWSKRRRLSNGGSIADDLKEPAEAFPDFTK